MPSFGPIASAPISSVGAPTPPPDLSPNIEDGLRLELSGDTYFLNVLMDAAVGGFPMGDAVIRNLLESGGAVGTASIANVRMLALASDAALLLLEEASQVLIVIKERIVAASDFNCRASFKNTGKDGGKFTDAVASAWGMLLADAGSASDDAQVTLRKLAALAETLHALGNVQGKLMAQAAVAVAAALEARVVAGWSVAAVDQAAMTDEARNTLTAMLATGDSAIAGDVLTPSLRMLLLASDAATVADDPAAMLRAFDTLHDGATLYCTLRMGGTDYQGWVLNTQLRAVTEYRNVPFDSFAIVNGHTYAAGDAGIVQLTGDTDNGQPIDAWFRPFLTNFGTHKMKRVTDIWIGASGTGLYVKVHTRNPATGQMTEDVYPVEYTHGTGTDKGRVKVGRGLSSNWWTLTVANVAGAPFDVNSIEWKPLMLDRRQ